MNESKRNSVAIRGVENHSSKKKKCEGEMHLTEYK